MKDAAPCSDYVRFLGGDCIKPCETTMELAYQQGQAALSQAYSRDQNPYPKGTQLHQWWDGGYCDESDELSPP